MASKKKTSNHLPPIEIDEFSKTMFHVMGYEPIPRVLAETYIQFKREHDKIRPSRLTEEGYATVVCIAKLKDPEAFIAPSAPSEPTKQPPNTAPSQPKKEESEDDEIDPFTQE